MRMNETSRDILDESVELFKAVADPVRLRLLHLLAAGEVCGLRIDHIDATLCTHRNRAKTSAAAVREVRERTSLAHCGCWWVNAANESLRAD